MEAFELKGILATLLDMVWLGPQIPDKVRQNLNYVVYEFYECDHECTCNGPPDISNYLISGFG